ncbi:MAG: MFS transporter [Anaerolineae bacterium]|nr:MFS transporter [Anaerolineae bacterium]
MTHTNAVQKSRLVERSPIFYGWVIWGIATISLVATSPGQSFSVSLFIDHYITDFDLSRTTVSGLYGLGTFLAALGLTWVGGQIDRRGNRKTGTLIAGLFALALLACSLIAGPVTILISFIAIRGLGQGALGLNGSTAIAEWFERRRGLVIGVSLVTYALFQRVYLPWLQNYIGAHGWRQTWILLGLVMAAVVLPLNWLLMRDRPGDFGLLPDGRARDDGDEEAAALASASSWTLKEAMRTPIFWTFVAGRALCSAWGTGLIFHQISLFANLGHSPLAAAETFGTAALMTAGTTLLTGWLIGRLRPGGVMALQLGGLVLACGLATVMTSSALLLVYAAAFGFFMGIGSVFDGTVWADLYGLTHQGTIRGFVASTLVTGTSIGPIAFGFAYDQLGSYTAVLWFGVALAVLLVVLSFIVPQPRRAAGQGA